jgi:hypothetical protein
VIKTKTTRFELKLVDLVCIDKLGINLDKTTAMCPKLKCRKYSINAELTSKPEVEAMQPC